MANRKLLLADDSITIQKVVELVLSEEDFQIKVVNNGQEAYAQVEVFKPNIILADIEMPEMNGYQLCEKIKKNSSTAHIPVVLLAGAFEPLDEELAKSVGADDFIIKPFESQELISKINAVLTSATIEGEELAIEAGEAEEVVETPAVAAEALAEETATPEPIEIAESVGEDLWEMEQVDAVKEEETGVFEISEEDTVSEEQIKAEVAEEEITGAIEDVMKEKESFREEVESIVEEPVKVHETVQQPGTARMPEMKMPSEDVMKKFVKESVQSQIAAAVQGMDIRGILSEAIENSLKDSLEKILSNALPGLIEKSLKEKLKDVFSSLGEQVENVIWETVPELGENIIKKEIEKIKSDF